jgi:hypothetical protein
MYTMVNVVCGAGAIWHNRMELYVPQPHALLYQ